jgi:hypothetical protein
MSFHLKDSVDSSHTELLSKKDRKLQANELKRAQDALEAFAKKNPEHASDAEQAKQFAKLTAKVAKLTQITTGVRPLETQDKLVFFIVAFLVALLPACTSISFCILNSLYQMFISQFTTLLLAKIGSSTYPSLEPSFIFSARPMATTSPAY